LKSEKRKIRKSQKQNLKKPKQAPLLSCIACQQERRVFVRCAAFGRRHISFKTGWKGIRGKGKKAKGVPWRQTPFAIIVN
jgi:hypothetical protein